MAILKMKKIIVANLEKALNDLFQHLFCLELKSTLYNKLYKSYLKN